MIDTQERNGTALAEYPQVDQLPSRGGFVESQARGEVDTQIGTAKRWPRSIRGFKQKAMELATLDEETAASCFYSLPRDGKSIEGPSARLAEIVAGAWGNLRVQANVVDTDGNFVTVRGICWDLENNVAVATEVRRRITGKNGRRFSDDMIVVTANAACSIALRNAIFKVIPMALVRPVYYQARKVAIGDAATLSSRRQKMIDHFAKMGVRPEQVCEKLGRAGVEDITLDDLGTMLGVSTAIKEGDTTVDEEFPAVSAKPAEKKSKGDELADSLTGAPAEKKAETAAAKPAASKANGSKKKPDGPPPLNYDALEAAINNATTQAQLQELCGTELQRSIEAGEVTSEGAFKLQERADALFPSLPPE